MFITSNTIVPFPHATAEAIFNLCSEPTLATNVEYRYQAAAIAITNTIATSIAISMLVIPFTLVGIGGLTPLFKCFVVLPTYGNVHFTFNPVAQLQPPPEVRRTSSGVCRLTEPPRGAD